MNVSITLVAQEPTFKPHFWSVSFGAAKQWSSRGRDKIILTWTNHESNLDGNIGTGSLRAEAAKQSGDLSQPQNHRSEATLS